MWRSRLENLIRAKCGGAFNDTPFSPPTSVLKESRYPTMEPPAGLLTPSLTGPLFSNLIMPCYISPKDMKFGDLHGPQAFWVHV